ncbi:tRNA (adenosine(37)-N6)-threonylcarbamoyltransferase complex ATPase subunit type 1 TsaE [uncultured Roseobacter sp.]|uniref:tRNA (adenosine(37)-N6)-threonylcarbamoyltransferase complex ATPase subunit type 1 TsaE n=1 Tax=uncultured Roseobacter sp. TaxID=114847 RepID=UPI00262C52D3|nr:tRNA (adenosine(37)-N6)-threonylcarbamoyltransferase complex ATPase subunit type 1 TsaE [uncultured Roseobacter sp.]
MGTDTMLTQVLDSEATAALAQRIGPLLHPGDTLLLEGDVGAGKTHFARHLIRSILITPEDIPSPTFTLVQTYDTQAGSLWHCDLYRIGTTAEIEELGLTEAFETAICLVEWPDRLGPLRPSKSLQITLAHCGDPQHRRLTIGLDDSTWNDRLGALLS